MKQLRRKRVSGAARAIDSQRLRRADPAIKDRDLGMGLELDKDGRLSVDASKLGLATADNVAALEAKIATLEAVLKAEGFLT